MEINPDHQNALLGLARLEATQGRIEEADLLLARAAEASPESDAPWRAAAELWTQAGQPEKTEQALEELLHRNPYDGSAAATLASLRRNRSLADARTLELEARAARFDPEANRP